MSIYHRVYSIAMYVTCNTVTITSLAVPACFFFDIETRKGFGEMFITE